MIRIGRRGRRSTQAPAGSVNRMNGRNSIVPSIANANGSTFRMMAAVRGMASRLICDPKTLIDWAAQSFWKSRLRIRRMTIMSLAASKPGAGVRDAGTCPLVGVRSHRGGGLEARLASRGREWDHRPVVGPGLAPGTVRGRQPMVDGQTVRVAPRERAAGGTSGTGKGTGSRHGGERGEFFRVRPAVPFAATII